jgi:hypothetical protein
MSIIKFDLYAQRNRGIFEKPEILCKKTLNHQPFHKLF